MRLLLFFIIMIAGTPLVLSQSVTSIYETQSDATFQTIGLCESDGLLYSIVMDQSLVFYSQKNTYYLRFYDGYEQHIVHDELSEVFDKFTQIKSFENYSTDFLIIETEVPYRVFLIHKKTFEIHPLHPDLQISATIRYTKDQEGNYYISVKDNDINHFYKLKSSKLQFLFSVEHTYVEPAVIFPLSEGFIFSAFNCRTELLDNSGNIIKTFTLKDIQAKHTAWKSEDCIVLGRHYFYDGQTVFRTFEMSNEFHLFDEKRQKFVPFNEFSLLKKSDKLHVHQEAIWYYSVNEYAQPILTVYSNDLTSKESVNNLTEINGAICFASSKPKDHIWIGNSSGIHHINFNQNPISSTLHGRSLRGIFPINEEELIIGSNATGWNSINRLTGQTKRNYDIHDRRTRFFPSIGFFKDDEGRVWTTLSNGFAEVVPPLQLKELYRWHTNQRANAVAFSNEYFYAAFSQYIGIFDRSTLQYSYTNKIPGVNRINYLLYKKDKVFIATNNGLHVMSKDGSEVENLIANNHFVSLYYSDPYYFLGTDEGYLLRFKDQIRNTVPDTLRVGKIVFSMTKGRDNTLWIGTSAGVAYTNKFHFKKVNFLPSYRLANPESNRYSIYFDTVYNKLYVGSIDGLSIIETDRIQESSQFNIKHSSATYFLSEKDSTIYYPVDSVTMRIDLAHRYITLKFTTSKMDVPATTIYEYSQNGSDWISLGANNSLRLSSLESGVHIINVRALKQGEIYSDNELTYRLTVGQFFYETWWFSLTIAAIILSIIGIFYYRIVSENVRLESQVEKRTSELEEDKVLIQAQTKELSRLNEMKNIFIRNITHELKTPLTLIKLPIMEELNKENLDQSTQENLLLVKENSSLLEERVDELLELSRMESGKLKIEHDSINLRLTCDKALSLFNKKANKRNQKFSANYEFNQSLLIETDSKKLVKIIQNLTNNAIKFTPKDGSISVTISYHDDNLSIDVTDSGIGIKEDVRSKIFERFFQIDHKNIVTEPGTGLGLTMVAEYVALLNGTISVDSTPGKGSTFLVNLPVKKVDRLIPSTASINENISSNKSASKKPKLLLVEDHDQLRSFVASLLNSLYDVTEAEDGAIALDKLNNGYSPDIILSDVMMPNVDGAELLRQVRSDERWKIIPFLFLTAKTDSAFKNKMYQIGVDDYITKPFDKEVLLSRITSLYKKYKERTTFQHILFEDIVKEEHLHDDTKITEENEFQIKINEIINANLLDSQFGVAFIASQMGVSSKTLGRLMKKKIGLTTIDYIKEFRLEKAREISQEQNTTDAQTLSQLVGIKNYHYFHDIFLERFGEHLNFPKN